MKRVLILLEVAAFTSGVGADILWDQCTGYQALLGCNAQDFEEVYDCYDCWAGDDFQVSDEPGWIVRDVHWIPYFSYGYAAVNRVNVAFTYLSHVRERFARPAAGPFDEKPPPPPVPLLDREDTVLHAALDVIEDFITGKLQAAAATEPRTPNPEPAQGQDAPAAQPTT